MSSFPDFLTKSFFRQKKKRNGKRKRDENVDVMKGKFEEKRGAGRAEKKRWKERWGNRGEESD